MTASVGFVANMLFPHSFLLTRLRVPLGFSYVPEEVSIDVFFEIVPVFDLMPETALGINGAIGCRYYF